MRWIICAFSTATVILFWQTPLRAEPVLDRVLSDAHIVSKKSCDIVRIGFNFRVRYVSHFPANGGTELRIKFRAIDRDVAQAQLLFKRESLRAPQSQRAAIRAIEFEARDAEGPVLHIQFHHRVFYEVGQGADFESIVVAISGKKPSKHCKPVFPSVGLGGLWNTTVTRAENGNASVGKSDSYGTRKFAKVSPVKRGSGAITESEIRKAGASMDEARAALKKKKYKQAIALLTKVLSYPEHEFSSEAQELLGVVRQRQGDLAGAQETYEEYLRRYNSGEDAERVRQRLDGIVTATQKAKSWSTSHRKLRRARNRGSEGSTWSLSGSASQFYIRDDSFRTVKDPSLPPDFNNQDDDHRVHENSLLSSLDAIASFSTPHYKGKLRFSGSEEHSFLDDEGELTSVASLFLELTARDYDLLTRVGRQTRNTGGVLGRFDGALVSWQANDYIQLNATAGSPVARRRDLPFLEDTFFYGASADIGPLFNGLDASVFAVEQRTDGLVDRRAIGTEFRYFDDNKSAFATIDYDIFYNELNMALFNGSWTLADKSTITANFDYRKSPFLMTTNALQGQLAGSLEQLSYAFSKDEVEQLALDRTATAKSASIGYSYPINELFQVSFDATITNISGTVASGGVQESTSTGNEYYLSTQLIANHVLTDDDITVLGLRYAMRELSDTYAVDLNTRFAVTPDLRINPGLRFSYLKSNFDDMKEYGILPSLRVNYLLWKDLSLEFEGRMRWSRREQGPVTDTESDFFFLLGYRYDFYAEDAWKKPVSMY